LSEDWIDFSLISTIAQCHPEWSIVLIGRSKLDIGMVCKEKNIRFLGIKDFNNLPQYSKYFDVALIPFKINELTLSSNPLKMFEYLASGLPVVSVNIPEVARYGNLVKIANTPEQFMEKINEALLDNDVMKKRYRSDAVEDQTWDNRLEVISDIIMTHSMGFR
jgi:glycosyltransferase involved in cell wall biosynthesis